jgi:nitrate/TMAO reductase-like tetraheme cytochrome c subunit
MESPEDQSSATPKGRLRLRDLFRNYISTIGLALAVVAFLNIVILFFVDLLATTRSPYLGIFAYMVMPGFLILGLLLIPIGMWRERSRRRTQAPEIDRFPRFDMNDPKIRSGMAFFLSFVVVFVLISAVGSYKAYEFTDSTQFCGQLCHTVMNPEFTAHQASAHARVTCVQCHVGEGAGWYVRSKLSGARQVFKTALNTFPRPIESPVANLRPAPETCEQCHWPKKFWGAQLKVINHFGNDEKNTPRSIRMLIKTGGGDPKAGMTSGIHWHMNIGNKITYWSDRTRQDIPYVKVEDQYGKVTEYYASGADQSKISTMQSKRMDCVDCHNRPTHVYQVPDRSVDQAMLTGRIDPSLPYAKSKGVEVLAGEYKTTPEALQAIATKVPAFYKEKYPDVAAAKQKEIASMVAELQRIFQQSIFPEMKVDWRTHKDNVGHFYFTGCFRCHDGNHTSKDGKVISKNCDSCHTILGQEEGGVTVMGSVKGVEFKHPVDLGDLTQATCTDCHTGGPQ